MKVAADRARVFVVQDDGQRDFSDATRFGRLVPLVNRDVFVDDLKDRLPAMQSIIRKKLQGFNGRRDFLLLTGDPVAIALAVFTLVTKTDRLQLLKWDREEKRYYPVTLTEQRGEP